MKANWGLVLLLLVAPISAFAARPLSTDDASTVDKGCMEVEAGFEYADDEDNEYNLSTALKYGLAERLDIGVEIPYQFIDVSGNGDVDGLGDIVVSGKYRFLDETEGFPALSFCFSLKTESADENKGLGSGELDYTINAILTKELAKVVAHLNLGYTYAGASQGEAHDDIFSYNFALECPCNDRLNFVGELTAETNFEGDFDDNAFSALAGLNYAVSEIVTFDLGMGWGISKVSSDYIVCTGITLAF